MQRIVRYNCEVFNISILQDKVLTSELLSAKVTYGDFDVCHLRQENHLKYIARRIQYNFTFNSNASLICTLWNNPLLEHTT